MNTDRQKIKIKYQQQTDENIVNFSLRFPWMKWNKNKKEKIQKFLHQWVAYAFKIAFYCLFVCYLFLFKILSFIHSQKKKKRSVFLCVEYIHHIWQPQWYEPHINKLIIIIFAYGFVARFLSDTNRKTWQTYSK